MKIILYGYEYPPLGGGVANALKHLLEEFSKYEDLEIDFITSSLDNKYKVEQKYPNIKFHYLKIGQRKQEDYHKQKPMHMISFSWKAYWYTWKLILRKKYDLNHFFGFPGGLVSLAFRWRMPYIVSLRGVDVPGYNERFKTFYLFYRPLSRVIWMFADKVITNSNGLRELARETAPKKPIEVIPNGVDIEKFHPVDKDKKYSKFSITAGGTLMGKKKGLRYLIEGFAFFHRQHRESQLTLIGSGDEEENLRELAKKLKIQNAVKFVGRKTHDWIAEHLPKFHVFVLPSLSEGMSNSALEALASGLPLILTNTGGTEEILNENGFVVQKKNPNEIHHRLKQLYIDPAKRTEMGRKSREIAEGMSWGVVGKNYHKLYKETQSA